MDKQGKLKLLKEKIYAADAIVVGGTSGMSAVGFKFAYGEHPHVD